MNFPLFCFLGVSLGGLINKITFVPIKKYVQTTLFCKYILYCITFHVYLGRCVYFRWCGRWEGTYVRSWSVTCENSKKIFSVTRTRRTSDNWRRIDYEPNFNWQLAVHSTRHYVLSKYSFLGHDMWNTCSLRPAMPGGIVIRSHPRHRWVSASLANGVRLLAVFCSVCWVFLWFGYFF